MFSSAQKPLHEKTMVSQLDAIGRLMAFKSQCSMSRDNFDGMLSVVGSLLSEGHILPKNLYESQKLLRALKMPYEQFMLVRMVASYLGKIMRKQHTVQSANPLGIWRSTLVMV
jgi:hypothetical protein